MLKEFEFTSEVGQFTDAPQGLNMHHLVVPSSVVKKIKGTFPARFVIHLGDFSWHGAVMSMGDGRGFVMINRQNVKKLGLVIGSKVKLRMVEDDSQYGMPMCDELQEVLLQDPEASRRFHGMTPGKQRNIIHYVGKIKNPQLRIDKALFFMENLKALPEGKEDVGRIIGAKKD
jgi:hypothetical protein